MEKTFIITVTTEYPHRLVEADAQFRAIYDREGFAIGTVTDVVSADDHYVENL